LLRDVIEDDDGVGDIVVVPIAPREVVKVVVLALREEEEEEDGLEFFSIVHTTRTRPHTGERNVNRVFHGQNSLKFCLSVF
jgi:hypothetical protein